MILKKSILFILTSLLFASCVELQPVCVTRYNTLDQYTYFYITPTGTKTSSSGGVFSNGFGVYGLSQTKSTNPADIISGFMIKKGLIQLPELNNELAEKTMIINYGETGRCNMDFSADIIEITLQILSAKTNEIICVVTGEGHGETEADGIRVAIYRCLEELYQK